jgi:hypothetical protein
VSLAAGFLAVAPFSFTVGAGTAGDEAAFSAGLGTELSEVGRSLCSSAAGAVNSSLNASRAQVESISLQSSNRFLAFSAAGLLAVVPFSLPAGDEAPFSSAAEDVSSKARRAHAVAIWRKAKRAAPSRLSTAHWLQSFDSFQQSSANDVITPKRAVSFRHEVNHWR